MSGPGLAHAEDDFGLATDVHAGVRLLDRLRPAQKVRGHDELAPARGVIVGCMLGIALWVLLIVAAAALLQLL